MTKILTPFTQILNNKIYFKQKMPQSPDVLTIYVALGVFQSYHNLEAGGKQSLKSSRQDWESNPGPLAPQAKSLTTKQCCSHATIMSFC